LICFSELREIAIAWAAGSQVVQIGFSLCERNPVKSNSPQDVRAGTSGTLRIWKLLEQTTAQRVESPLLFLC